MGVPRDLLYTRNHQWVRLDKNSATVGISYYGQLQLGQIVFIDLPDVDKSVSASETLATIESSKAAVEIQSPLSGTVIKVNETLSKTPEYINTSPYKDGWICVLKMRKPDEKNLLLDAQAYDALLESI